MLTRPAMRSRPADALRETGIILRDDLLTALRSFLGIAALVLYAAMNLAVALPYLKISALLEGKLAEQETTARVAMAVGGKAAWLKLFQFLADDDAQAAQAMLDVPLQAIFIFTMAAFFVPLVSIIVSHDIIAEDLRSGHIRFLSVRCRRGSLVVGRLLARSALMAAVIVIVGVGTFCLMAVRGDGLPHGAWLHFARYTALLAGMAPCYVGLAGLISTLVRSPFVALVLSLSALFGLVILGFASDQLGWIAPSYHKGLLYAPGTWPRGIAAYLAFAGGFGALAWLRLKTRDL